ncbi:4-hydroxy-3-methylbut-2-enyl diphosphate reductase [Bacteroides faecichinchillae]|uniref:4-hydroxy-3-methylbut-2-enyl diphosphate reductase n=2 Tax=Bacteroides faecichinchillae TaxID=871325 RepID=A0A1M4YFE8_9BACE|nr:4-hydroxy-3-methylbut-2-enyl diphosphate reductase [Bacteroides faecichinchillae]
MNSSTKSPDSLYIKYMIKVEIDEGSGFCFGVVTAIDKAEEELTKGETLYCLGDIVHNSKEVERLKEMGLITINHDEFKQLRNAKVLLRAHGEPPETYMTARENNIEIIDATCPVVLRLQKRIKQGFLEDNQKEKQIVIYGKNGHAEVLGLVGQTDGQAIVIEKAEEVKKLDFNKSIRLFSQTTKSLDEFQEIVEYIKQHISPKATFEYYDTICRQVANRMPKLREFAASHDLIFFVSGKKSSNGKMLFEECLKVNPNSHLIDSQEEIDASLLQDVTSIGVCGATSTPKWLMEKISRYIQTQIKE